MTKNVTAEGGERPAAEYVDPRLLRQWVKNPRKNNAAVRKVAESIKRFGFGAPIVANRGGEIIAGHTRLKAALALHLPIVPVRYLDLSEEEAHKLSIADNKLGELAEWDDEELSKIIGDFSDEDKALLGVDEKAVLDYSAALVEEETAIEPEFCVIFKGPLELQADVIEKLQKIARKDSRITIEAGI